MKSGIGVGYRHNIGQVIVLLLLFSLTFSSLSNLSPTYDEQGFITRGLGYLRRENKHLRVGHPLGLNALNASLLVFDSQVALPLDDPSWNDTNFHRPSELFMWEIGNDVPRIMLLARLPTVFLGMLLTAVIGRWAQEITRSRWAALLAMLLAALDPNLIAHSQLATTDLGLAAGATLAGFLLWRYWRRPSWRAAAWAGIGFGLLQNTKFTAGLFVPLFALVMLLGLVDHWRKHGHFPATILIQLLIVYPLAAFITLWAGYGFQIDTLPENLPSLPQLGGLTVPLSYHLEQLLDIGARLQKGTPSFLMGQYSDSGWWYYFPVAFMLKTPLPTLLLLILALVCFGREKLLKKGGNTAVTNSSLLIPALGYFAIALTTDINLGYRHLLPVLPFLFIFVAAVLVPGGSQLSPKQFILPGALITWLAITTVAIYPHYLAFFNRLAGGPDGGWRYLVDSNIDWGQDLAGLKTWLDANGVDRVWLSYFGEARPDYYNINHIGLDSFPPRLMNPQTRPFYPYNPAPGIYAISATNLQGVQFADHDLFAWFRDKKPVAKIGYSIFIYDVPAHGEPIDLALGSIQLDELMSEDFVRLGTNDVTLHWFDAATSLLWPTDGATWLVKAGDTTAHPFLNSLLPSPVVQNDEYALYQLVWSTTDDIGLTSFNNGAGVIRLVESQLEEETAVPGKSITIHSQFYNQSPPQPVKIYLHLINHNGAIVAQWDGLGAAWEGWREGDLLWQKHQMTIPTDTQPGVYHLKIGLYHPETGQRWLTPDDHDFFTAGTIKVAK